MRCFTYEICLLWEVTLWMWLCSACACVPAYGREPLTYTKNTIKHVDASEKYYRDLPFLCRVFSVSCKYQRAADAWYSSVVSHSNAQGWFVLSGSHSHLGRSQATAQFSAVLASLQPLGGVVWDWRPSLTASLVLFLFSLWKWVRDHF